MECNNVLDLQKLKNKLESQLKEVNKMIKHGDRNKITPTIIKNLQRIRSHIENDIKTCNSLLNNPNIAFIDITGFTHISNCHIINVDEYLVIINRISR